MSIPWSIVDPWLIIIVFMAIPERVVMELGFSADNMPEYLYFIVWIVITIAIYYFFLLLRFCLKRIMSYFARLNG